MAASSSAEAGPRRKKARKVGGDTQPADAEAAGAGRKPGSVAELLGGLAAPASTTSKPARSRSSSGEGELNDTFSRLFTGAASLFAGAAATATSSQPQSPRLAAVAGNDGVKAATKLTPGSGAGEKGKGDAAAGKKAGAKAKDEKLAVEKKRRLTPEEKTEREARTLFIGNVPLDWDKKALRRALQKAVGDKYTGAFQPIWFRAVPLKEKWTWGKLRKAGSILKEYDDMAADAKHAYAVVESAEDLKTVRLAVHGYVADKRHTLRADGVGESSKLQTFDRKRSVFVGNLPANTGEADLRHVFEKAGEVNAVRVVRDKVTKQCKGIAFVLFKDRSSVKAALQYWGASVKGREIRVTRVEQRDPDGNGAEQSNHPAALRIERKLRRRKPKSRRPEGAGPPRSSKRKKGKDERAKGKRPKTKSKKAKKGKP